MADLRLRNLQRLAAQDPSMEGCLLREQFRQGRISLQQLELLAFLAHEPALHVLAEPTPRPASGLFEDWVAVLGNYGRRPLAVAGVVVAQATEQRLAQSRLKRPVYTWGLERLGQATRCLESWLSDPDRSKRAAAQRLMRAIAEHPDFSYSMEFQRNLQIARAAHSLLGILAPRKLRHATRYACRAVSGLTSGRELRERVATRLIADVLAD